MSVSRVLILSDGPFVAEVLSGQVGARYPGASCRQVREVAAAAELLGSRGADIFVLQLELLGSDGLDFLRRHRTPGVRTLVVSGRAEPRVAMSLRSLGVEAVHDCCREPTANIVGALDALDTGRRHWSDSFDACLRGTDAHRIRHQLTPSEQLAFALLATGLGEKALADHLGLALSSARSLGRDCRAKLGLHDRLDVEREGARLGYTRFGSGGLATFGLSVLIEEYYAQSRRPSVLSAALLAECGVVREAVAGIKRAPPPSRVKSPND